VTRPLSPSQAAKLANSAYATLGSRTPNIAAAAAAGVNRDVFAIDTSKVFTGVTGFGTRTNFGYCAFGKKGSREGECVISVRGTNMPSGSDWLTNAKFSGDHGPNGHMVHQGFNQLTKSILPQLRNELLNKKLSAIHLVGHSLGGSTATLLADALKSHVDMYLYTFGAPRAGGAEHAQYLTQKLKPNNIFRVYHDTDPVPMVPVFPYTHCPVGADSYLLKGSGMVIWPGAHSMDLYEKNCGGSWGALNTIAHRRFSLETIDDVLKQAGAVPGGFLSSMLMRLIVKALRMIMEAAGMLTGLALLGTATIVDQLAYILTKGVQIAGATADIMKSLITQIMRFLGVVVGESVSLTQVFLRWLTEKLFATLSGLARQALRHLV
jgi:hypothetical protein